MWRSSKAMAFTEGHASAATGTMSGAFTRRFRRRKGLAAMVDLARPGRVAKRTLVEVGLLRKVRAYQIGESDFAKSSIIETRLSWLGRCFGWDRYEYLVTSLEWDGEKKYIIERVERLSYVDPTKVVIPDGYSGLYDERRGVQRDPLWGRNAGRFGERSALTVYGFWIGSDISFDDPLDFERAGPEGPFPSLGSPFAGGPVPHVVRFFDTEQAAYSYLENVNGEKIPARIRHIAWVAIATSTILWQWQDKIFGTSVMMP